MIPERLSLECVLIGPGLVKDAALLRPAAKLRLSPLTSTGEGARECTGGVPGIGIRTIGPPVAGDWGELKVPTMLGRRDAS